ncbi:acyl-CoA dehydrogenase, partial [Brevibacterium paucivorans]
IANVSSTIGDLFTPAMNEKRIRSGRLQEALLASRAEVTLTELAANLRPANKMSSTDAAELFNDHQNDLIETARAFIELHKWRALNDLMHSVDPKDNPAEAKFLRRIRDLYGLEL